MVCPKAFIFDLDGVITDTAEFHYQAWKKLSSDIGISIDRKFNEQLKGVSRIDSLERILEYGNKSDTYCIEEKKHLAKIKNDEYNILIDRITKKDVLPNIEGLLHDLSKQNIKIGIASASKNAFKVIENLQIGHYIDYIADASKIKRSKPYPDVFLDVMYYFRFSENECIGIEDAKAGISAIKAANMFAVGIGDRKDLSMADLIFNDTMSINLNTIIEEYNKKVIK